MIDETVNYDSGIRNYNRMLEGKRAFILMLWSARKKWTTTS